MSLTMKRQSGTLVSLLSLAAFFLLSTAPAGFTQSFNRTEIKKIRPEEDIPERIQRYRRQVWENARRDQVLENGNWLVTGNNSTAWMWYTDTKITYRQDEHTMSRFKPDSECGFRVSSGKTLMLIEESFRGCHQVTDTLQVKPSDKPESLSFNASVASTKSERQEESAVSGFFMSRSPDEEITLIGALANPDEKPIEVTNLVTEFSSVEDGSVSKTIRLQAGDFLIVRDNGSFIKGEFSIEDFYKNNLLTLGLGNSPEDQAYADSLESLAERELFSAIRSATLSALAAQPTPGAFEVQRLNDRDLPSLFSPELSILGFPTPIGEREGPR